MIIIQTIPYHVDQSAGETQARRGNIIMIAEIFSYDLIQAHFSFRNLIHNLESELRMTASILKDYPDRRFPHVLIYLDAPGSSEHCRGRYRLLQRRDLTRVCIASRRHGRSGFSQGRPFAFELGKDPAAREPREGSRGGRASAGRRGSERRTSRRSGSPRIGSSRPTRPGSAGASKSRVIGGTHEAPVSHPLRMKAGLLVRPRWRTSEISPCAYSPGGSRQFPALQRRSGAFI